MKRILSVLLAAALLITLLVSCGKETPNDSPAAAKQAEQAKQAVSVPEDTDITDKFTDPAFLDFIRRDVTYKIDGEPILAGDVASMVSLLCQDAPISSLNGIEYFTSLEELYCENNKLTTLDVSKNTALKGLHCNNNQLTSLDLSKNTALITLSCTENQLTTFDLSNNTSLEQLWCDNNQLATLNVSKNSALINLYCQTNRLTTLDVSHNTGLGDLRCKGNQIKTINLNKYTAPYNIARDDSVTLSGYEGDDRIEG